MNKKRLVQLSNIIGIVAIVALLYWTFIYTVIEVNGLKVFRGSITETFFQSISGILALMAGALMINIMLNLTRIAEKVNGDIVKDSKLNRIVVILLIISFPIIAALLFAGDRLTKEKKKNKMIESAKFLVQKHRDKINTITNYRWDSTYLHHVNRTIHILNSTDAIINNIAIIIPDTADGIDVYLKLHENYRDLSSDKDYFIYRGSKEEIQYLEKVYKEKFSELLFIANRGYYELYYPINNNGKPAVLYFSDYMDYGKN